MPPAIQPCCPSPAAVAHSIHPAQKKAEYKEYTAKWVVFNSGPVTMVSLNSIRTGGIHPSKPTMVTQQHCRYFFLP